MATTRRGTRATANAEDRLTAIKRVAVKWFSRRGYEGTDLRLIAQDLKLHPSSLYNYIRSKQELLYLILKEGMEEVHAGFDAAVEGLEDPTERLAAALRFHVVQNANRREVAWTSHIEVRALKGKYRTAILALRDQYQEKWVNLFRDGLERGVFRDLDPEITAFGVLAMAQTVARWFNPRGRFTPEEIANEYVALALKGVCRDPQMIPQHVPGAGATS